MNAKQNPPNLQQSLIQISQAIRDNPNTGGGVQLRRFLWSLYNMHHLVNLWTLVSRLDQMHSQLVLDILAAALVGNLKESDIKVALQSSGEMERWDRAHPCREMVDRFYHAKYTIEDLIKTLPPCRIHTSLVRLLREFEEVESWLR